MAKNYLLLSIAFLCLASCQKNIDFVADNLKETLPINSRKNIARMVEVNKAEMQNLTALTAQRRASAQRTTSNGEQFTQQQLQNYCEQLLAIEPQRLEPAGFQVNIPYIDWSNDPCSIETDAATILPASMTHVLSRVENNVMAIVENLIYEQQDTHISAITDLRAATYQERNSVDQI